MDRTNERASEVMADDDVVRDGSLVMEERINRRDGLVEYDGTVGGGDVPRDTGMAADATTLPSTETDTVTSQTMRGSTGLDSTAPIPSMSTDQSGGSPTAMRSESTDAVGTSMLSRVREGMKVVDAAGDDIGKVVEVRMGDPAAATTAGQVPLDTDTTLVAAAPVSAGTNTGGTLGGGSGILGLATDADTDLNAGVDTQTGSQLTRAGFIKVDGKGWIDTDRLVSAESIADVSNDTVTLNIAKEAIPEA